jgi:demethylmenaquinone methyltransferase / 2-methoxy-6-polyprenyl-1,4-benzoquinol methylase
MTHPSESGSERFRPHAVQALAGMFDDVSPRYDLLNRLMTLGQDRAWRAAMGRLVPPRARVVLDLCTGSGASLEGLLETGRQVLGIDASPRMLAHAAEAHGGRRWGPRLVCADAFRLPLPDACVDAVTVAFGIRNLRPRAAALAEIARVLRPGGTLVVLEATPPPAGPLAPLQRAWIRHAIPALGRLSSEPAAYQYLARSIFEFGPREAFERDLAEAGCQLVARESFMFGATHLWAARRGGEITRGANRSTAGPTLHDARPPGPEAGELPHARAAIEREWRAWTAAQLAIAAILAIALVDGFTVYRNLRARLPLQPWQNVALQLLLVGGAVFFGLRTIVLVVRLLGPPPRK